MINNNIKNVEVKIPSNSATGEGRIQTADR